MNFEEYQSILETFAVYPRDEKLGGLGYLAFGLNGEADEVARANVDKLEKRRAANDLQHE